MAECTNVKESKTPTSVIYNNNNLKSHIHYCFLVYVMDSTITKAHIIMHQQTAIYTIQTVKGLLISIPILGIKFKSNTICKYIYITILSRHTKV